MNNDREYYCAWMGSNRNLSKTPFY